MNFPNIEAERVRNSMTRKDLADNLDVSPKTLSNWMNGKTEISYTALIKMTNLWNCSSDYLLGIDHNKMNVEGRSNTG